MDNIQVDKDEDVKHLGNSLYSVRSKLIEFATNNNYGDGDLKFFNPRCVLIQGVPAASGFEKQSMEELKKAIQSEGLHHPLLLRGFGKNVDDRKFTILGGERRFRCIDLLKEENADCWDETSKKMVPARKLYEFIEAKILFDIDEATAFKHAFSGNERATDIGDGATVALVKLFRDSGYSDKQIAEITGKSITWIRDTDNIIALNDKIFDAFARGDINRTVALALTEVEDSNDRMVRFEKARTAAAERLIALKNKADINLEEAEKEAEFAEATAVAADCTGNKQVKSLASKKANKLQKTIAKRLEEKEGLESKFSVVGSKDLEKIDIDEDPDFGKRLTFAKIEKHWLGDLEAIIGSGGLDNDGTQIIDVHDAILLKEMWLNGIEKGEKNVINILKKHYARKLILDSIN